MKVKCKHACFLSALLDAEFVKTCKNVFQEWFEKSSLFLKVYVCVSATFISQFCARGSRNNPALEFYKIFWATKELQSEFPAVNFFRASVSDIDGLKDVVWSLNSQSYLSWPFWLIKQKGICLNKNIHWF